MLNQLIRYFDLQSGHRQFALAMRELPLDYSMSQAKLMPSDVLVVPGKGFEPSTVALQMRCSTN
jgi:hypothetical protein